MSVGPDGTPLPESSVLDATPTVRVRARWIVAFSLAVVGVAAGWFGPIQILLPAQAARLQDLGLGSKEAVLAIVTASGAVASMIANPLWGGFSDRTRSAKSSRARAPGWCSGAWLDTSSPRHSSVKRCPLAFTSTPWEEWYWVRGRKSSVSKRPSGRGTRCP